jgi:hypothetical protein
MSEGSSSSYLPYIAIGFAVIAIALGGYYTYNMGCKNSVVDIEP